MSEDSAKKPVSGIVMPISAIDGCLEGHWSDVREILVEAIEDGGFEANLVSNADDVGIIQKRIIQNLYDNPIVVCDVSGKNPNVMFELGMRLAFDRPAIIVKDDKTSYSFDTSPIEHVEYPRDLRFSKIVEFKVKLADKIRNTHQRAREDAGYTTFLKHFGEFTVAKIDKREVPGQEFILDELRSLHHSIEMLSRRVLRSSDRERFSRSGSPVFDICLGSKDDSPVEAVISFLRSQPQQKIESVLLMGHGENHKHLKVRCGAAEDATYLRQQLGRLFPMSSFSCDTDPSPVVTPLDVETLKQASKDPM